MGIHDENVLVTKNLWNIVVGTEVRPPRPIATTGASGGQNATDDDPSSTIPALPPTHQQSRWDGRDAQAHALIALYIKRGITPRVRSCSTSKGCLGILWPLFTNHAMKLVQRI